MLVRFSCGCLGLEGIQGDEADRAVCLNPCDLNHSDCWEPLGVYRRDLSDKTTTPLEPAKAAELLAELNGLVKDGYRFRQVRTLLNPPLR